MATAFHVCELTLNPAGLVPVINAAHNLDGKFFHWAAPQTERQSELDYIFVSALAHRRTAARRGLEPEPAQLTTTSRAFLRPTPFPPASYFGSRALRFVHPSLVCRLNSQFWAGFSAFLVGAEERRPIVCHSEARAFAGRRACPELAEGTCVLAGSVGGAGRIQRSFVGSLSLRERLRFLRMTKFTATAECSSRLLSNCRGMVASR